MGGADGMTRVTTRKSRVRESRTPGSVRAKAEWLSYSTATQPGSAHGSLLTPVGGFDGPNQRALCFEALIALCSREGSLCNNDPWPAN